jgi:antitoxin component YwqK of YwqJK toxin-antitoxin module
MKDLTPTSPNKAVHLLSPIFFLIFLLILVACNSKTKVIEIRNDEGQVIEKYEENIKTKKKDGFSELYNPDGSLLEKASYKDGQLDGIRTLFYSNGKTEALENYENGVFKGNYQAFYQNGQLELEGKYTNGMMNGEWKRFYDSGELMELVNFVENEENGPFIEYYKNGKLKAEGAYLDGDNEHGELKLYNEKGDLIKKMNCNKGICRTSWTKETEDKKI